ncbi:hypothetical protein V8E54_014531 [Elaphomyces granulatus]
MIETRSIASVRRRCDEGKGQAAQSKRGNVNRDEDIELLNVEFDVVEDIPAEKPHEGFLPVVAELADMLLDQGCYIELSQGQFRKEVHLQWFRMER